MNVKHEKRIKSNKVFIICAAILILFCCFLCGIHFNKSIYKIRFNNFNKVSLFENLLNDEPCYVIGHMSPDTDTVCTAILLSDYLKKYGINCEARISGKINNETKFIFDYFDIGIPEVLDDASGKNIILVDHNEYSQSISGMKDAKIIGIVDHHNIANLSLNEPIVSETLNVGSTATIIYIWYKMSNLQIDKKTASLIASAILSDTSYLKSTTTTNIDKYALDECIKIAKIKNIEQLYFEMEKAALSYDGMTDREIFFSDYKEYNMSGQNIGIACINAVNKDSTDKMVERMKSVMKEIYNDKNIKHLFISVENYDDNETILVGYGDGANEILEKAYGSIEVVFKSIVSRKKDIVPKLKKVYDIIYAKNE